jgi:hypothetical protein
MGLSQNPRLPLIGGFPDRVRLTLRYVDRIIMTSSTVGTQYIFAGNDCYDPNVTSTGLQPNNFDDWMVQYTRFKVHGSRCRVEMLASGTNYLAAVSIGARQNQSIGTVIDDASRPRHSVYWVNGYQRAVFDAKYSTQQILGMTKSQYEGTELLTGTASASPSTLWFWGIRHESYDSSTSVVTPMIVTIDYDVEIYQRLDQQLDLFTRIKEMKQARGAAQEKREETKSERGFELVELTKLSAAASTGVAGSSYGTPVAKVGAGAGGAGPHPGSLFRSR